MRLAVRFVVALCMIGITSAWATSFDCAKASSRIENAICASPTVSKLDSDLATAYQSALAQSSELDAVKAAQRGWIKETRNQCTDEACLINVYQQRIAALTPASIDTRANGQATADSKSPADANQAATPIIPGSDEKVTTPVAVADSPNTNALTEASATPAPTVAPPVSHTVVDQKPAGTSIATDKLTAKPEEPGSSRNPIGGVLIVAMMIGTGWIWIKRKGRPSIVTQSVEPTSNESSKISKAASSFGPVWVWAKGNPIKTGLVCLFVLGAVVGKAPATSGGPSGSSWGSPSESEVLDKCEGALIEKYAGSDTVEFDFKTSYRKAVPNTDGSFTAVTQAHLEVRPEYQQSHDFLNSAQHKFGQYDSSDDHLGWQLWRCQVSKDKDGYKATDLRMISGSEGDAIVARAKK